MERNAGRGWLVVALVLIVLAICYWTYRNYRKYHPVQEITIEQEVSELEIEENE